MPRPIRWITTTGRPVHSKILGTSGELRVAHELYKRGIPCFGEMGDTSRIDLIAEVAGRLVKIQVKALSRVDGAYELSNRKKAKGYEFLYASTDVDIFAVYCVDDDCVAWVRAVDFIQDGKRCTHRMRALPAKNGQARGVKLLSDYLDFNKAFGLAPP